MTLNITVISKNRIYQSSDYQLFDNIRKRPLPFGAKKIFLVSTFEWSATISFTGIALGNNLNVSLWLSKAVNKIDMKDPFQKLIDLLLEADQWLGSVQQASRYLSISIGAFLQNKPYFILLSNFETMSGSDYKYPNKKLKVEMLELDIPRTFVTGQKLSITSVEKIGICSIAVISSKEEYVFERIYELNRKVAKENNLVSEGCEIVYLDSLGRTRSWSVPHSRSLLQVEQNPLIAGLPHSITKTWNNSKTIKFIGSARSPSGEREHLHFIQAEPDKAEHYSNYANFLTNKGELEKAEEMCHKALVLDSRYVNAINHLGNIKWRKNDEKSAESLYLRGLKIKPNDPNLGANYALLLRATNRLEEGIVVINHCIKHNPQYKKARLIKGEILLCMRDANALIEFAAARGRGSDQKRVESGYAMATSLVNLPLEDKIAAYRTALSLQPDEPDLLLNLSQLLFISDCSDEAKSKLLKAISSDKLSGPARLEACFYQLAHTAANLDIIKEKIKGLLAQGFRLDWDVDADIEMISKVKQRKSNALKQLKKFMVSPSCIDCLDSIISNMND